MERLVGRVLAVCQSVPPLLIPAGSMRHGSFQRAGTCCMLQSRTNTATQHLRCGGGFRCSAVLFAPKRQRGRPAAQPRTISSNNTKKKKKQCDDHDDVAQVQKPRKSSRRATPVAVAVAVPPMTTLTIELADLLREWRSATANMHGPSGEVAEPPTSSMSAGGAATSSTPDRWIPLLIHHLRHKRHAYPCLSLLLLTSADEEAAGGLNTSTPRIESWGLVLQREEFFASSPDAMGDDLDALQSMLQSGRHLSRQSAKMSALHSQWVAQLVALLLDLLESLKLSQRNMLEEPLLCALVELGRCAMHGSSGDRATLRQAPQRVGEMAEDVPTTCAPLWWVPVAEEAVRRISSSLHLLSCTSSSSSSSSSPLPLHATSMAILMMASSLGKSVDGQSSSSSSSSLDANMKTIETNLRRCRTELERRIQPRGASPHSSLADLLATLRIFATFDIPDEGGVRDALRTTTMSAIAGSCRAASDVRAGKNALLLLMDSIVAARLHALREVPEVHATLCTTLLSAVAQMVRRDANASSLQNVVAQAEATCWAAAPSSGSSSSSSSSTSTRPPLASPTVMGIYALLCLGYDAEPILESSMCVSLSVGEWVDVVRMMDLFSISVATSPLPARAQQHFVGAVLQELGPARKVWERASSGATATSMLAGRGSPKRLSLSERMKLMDEARASAQRGSQSVDEVLHASLHAVMECILRGDAVMVGRLWQRMAPLLEDVGGPVLLAEAMEWCAEELANRLASMGTLAAGPTPFAVHLTTTTMAMEEAMVAVASFCLPRLAEQMLRATSRRSTSSSSSSSTRGRPTMLAAAPPENRPDLLTAEEVKELHAMSMRLSVSAMLLGMPSNTITHLIALHAGVVKALDPSLEGAASMQSAMIVVEELHDLVERVSAQHLRLARHPHSAKMRFGSMAMHEVVAVRLIPTADAARQQLSGNNTPPELVRYILSVAHLLFRLGHGFMVEAEPPLLSDFRIHLCDAALSRAIASPKTNPTLEMLMEMAVVMYSRKRIHHVSSELVVALAQAVVKEASSSSSSSSSNKKKTTMPISRDGEVAYRLLAAASTICMRADPILTHNFMLMLDALGDRLSMEQSAQLLDELAWSMRNEAHPAVVKLLQRLMRSLPAMQHEEARRTSTEELQKIMRSLHTLLRYRTLVEKREDLVCPYGSIFAGVLMASTNFDAKRYTIMDCASLLVLIASLQASVAGHGSSFVPLEMELLATAPRIVVVHLHQRVREWRAEDLPHLLRGFASMRHDADLRDQMMRQCIARTIRGCPIFSPEELVMCVEAYGDAAMPHHYLFGVLLSRVADVKALFSLDLSIRLLRCGGGVGMEEVRRTCLTAAKPIFFGHVRHIIQSDAAVLTSVASTSTIILRCLRECFPKDPLCAKVLEVVGQHHVALGLSIARAALELAAARGSSDHAVVRVLGERCTQVLMPTASAEDVAELAHLLVSCGVRSASLVEVLTSRIIDLRGTMHAYPVALIASAMVDGCLEVPHDVLVAFLHRIRQLTSSSPSSSSATSSARGGGGEKSSSTRRGRRGRDDGELGVAQDGGVGIMHDASSLSYTLHEVALLARFLAQCCGSCRGEAGTTAQSLLAYASKLFDAARRRPDNTHKKKHDHDGVGVDGDDDHKTNFPLPAEDAVAVLRCCWELTASPEEHECLVKGCSAALEYALGRDEASSSSSSSGGVAEMPAIISRHGSMTACHSSTNLLHHDLSMLVEALSLLTRLGHSHETTVERICAVLYERRAGLLQRHLLVARAREALHEAGEEVHPQLYGCLMAVGAATS